MKSLPITGSLDKSAPEHASKRPVKDFYLGIPAFQTGIMQHILSIWSINMSEVKANRILLEVTIEVT